jgi:hypothetical protein
MPHTSRREWLTAVAGGAIAIRALGADADELSSLTLKQASDRIRSKKVSPVELTEACLARIKTYQRVDYGDA